jgi:hypothetical protein
MGVILKAGKTTIGRNKGNDFRISDPSVEECHATIEISEDGLPLRAWPTLGQRMSACSPQKLRCAIRTNVSRGPAVLQKAHQVVMTFFGITLTHFVSGDSVSPGKLFGTPAPFSLLLFYLSLPKKVRNMVQGCKPHSRAFPTCINPPIARNIWPWCHTPHC